MPDGQAFLITRITARTDARFVPAYTGMVRAIASSVGFPEAVAEQLELVAEEACLNVITQAFPGDDASFFDISIERRPGQLVLVVEDKGIPCDWQKIEQRLEDGLSLRIMRAYLDEIRHVNRGRDGKRVELIKNLPQTYPGETELRLPRSPAQDEVTGVAVPLSVRLMAADEGVDLARCFYRCYGYSYLDFVYHPDRIRERIEQGLQISVVAVTPAGEIVGHVAVNRETPDARVAETGQAAVDPRFRSRGLFESLKRAAAGYARHAGICGFYSESVTIHPYTQRGNLSLGAVETGILLSYVPQQFSFHKIEASLRNRQTSVLFYLRLEEEPPRQVFLPHAHSQILHKICKRGGFHWLIREAGAEEPMEGRERTRADLHVVPDLGIGFIKLRELGCDWKELVQSHVREMCENRVECIYLDLPLSDPASARSSSLWGSSSPGSSPTTSTVPCSASSTSTT
jgi:anti-sigma regulatory factor (Ser/Thr protein kinase)/GNAT superfamily N-acetyltransferase